MKYVCSLLIFGSAVAIVCSLFRYYKTLLAMRRQTYDAQLFRHPIYALSIIMILAFFLGYVTTAVIILLLEYRRSTLLIASIFFCGALFVFCMVQAVQQMCDAITKKTSEIIQAMVNSIEAKDRYTKGHSVHVMRLTGLIYERLPADTQSAIDPILLRDAALLHDIGKISMPDNILNKPGKLTAEEMAIVRQHPKNGTLILEKTSYKQVSSWVLYHHERMDGNGYHSLPGDQVPIESRILAVADTFSALYTDRIYRARLSYPDAIDVLQEAAGTQLDATLVELFCAIDKQVVDEATVLESG